MAEIWASNVGSRAGAAREAPEAAVTERSAHLAFTLLIYSAFMTNSWRTLRNVRSLERLYRTRPHVFPGEVWTHALRRGLVPVTLSRAVESYWRQHPIRADQIARALARRSAPPVGWTWQLRSKDDEGPANFRIPPTPYRAIAFSKGPGHCCICGQPVFRFGWHADLWSDGDPNLRARWHAACVQAWKFWNAPSEQITVLKRLQKHRCALTGRRLLKTVEVDHRTPLFQVWSRHREGGAPRALLGDRAWDHTGG